MTTTQTPALAQPVTKCPPSDVCDEIVRWDKVQAGELVLDKGDFVTTLERALSHSEPAYVGFRIGEHPNGDPLWIWRRRDKYTAVRRYTEGEPPEVEQLRAELAQQVQATRDVDDLRMTEIGQLRAEVDRFKVRRALYAAALDEAADDRDERASWAQRCDRAEDYREHTGRAGEYREARDELIEAAR